MNQLIKQRIEDKLISLEKALQQANLWQKTPPDHEALSSCEPFCVDTLDFEAWLQWVFIPKMRCLIQSESFSGLGQKSDIYTMAKTVFAGYSADTSKVCFVLREIDVTLNLSLKESTH